MKHGTFTVRSGRVINELPISALAQRFGKLCLNFASNKIRIFKKSCIEFFFFFTIMNEKRPARAESALDPKGPIYQTITPAEQRAGGPLPQQ
jgi:hypothetical protein